MKKVIIFSFFIFSILFLFLNVTEVSANSGPPIIGINIAPDSCVYDSAITEGSRYTFPGNFDILVRIEDFETDNFTAMNDKYKAFYPFYEDIEYLSNLDEGWTSFSAYYEGTSSWGYRDFLCGMQFGDYRVVEKTEYIKVVYFDDDGTTLFISDEIKIPNVLFFQDRDAVIIFNTTTNQIDPHLEPYTDGYFILAVVLGGLFILFSVAIELVIALVFKLKSKKALRNIIFINIVTQAIMYVYFLLIFNSNESSYFLHLYIYEILVLFIEFGYLYWRLKPISWKRLALYVLISNVVSYLLGIIRYF